MSDGGERDPGRTAPIVPAGGRFEGRLAFREVARVEGELIGPVEGRGLLELGTDALVQGRVEVDTLHSHGCIEGDVEARTLARMEAGATLRGTLTTVRLAVANGAVIQGRCAVGSRSE